MTVCGFAGGYVPDCFLAESSNFLDSPLVAWQLFPAKKLSITITTF